MSRRHEHLSRGAREDNSVPFGRPVDHGGHFPARTCGRTVPGRNALIADLPQAPIPSGLARNPVKLGTCAHAGGTHPRLGLQWRQRVRRSSRGRELDGRSTGARQQADFAAFSAGRAIREEAGKLCRRALHTAPAGCLRPSASDARIRVRCDHTGSQPDMTRSDESRDVLSSTSVHNRSLFATRARPVADGIWCG